MPTVVSVTVSFWSEDDDSPMFISNFCSFTSLFEDSSKDVRFLSTLIANCDSKRNNEEPRLGFEADSIFRTKLEWLLAG